MIGWVVRHELKLNWCTLDVYKIQDGPLQDPCLQDYRIYHPVSVTFLNSESTYTNKARQITAQSRETFTIFVFMYVMYLWFMYFMFTSVRFQNILNTFTFKSWLIGWHGLLVYYVTCNMFSKFNCVLKITTQVNTSNCYLPRMLGYILTISKSSLSTRSLGQGQGHTLENANLVTWTSILHV